MAGTYFDKYTRAIGLVREGQLHPAYFLLGPEVFLTERFIGQVKSTFTEKFGDSGEITRLYGEDIKQAELEGFLGGGGLFSRANLVILLNVSGLEQNARKLLTRVLKNPHTDLYLVLTHPETYRLPQWLSKMTEQCAVVLTTAPFDNELPRIIQRLAQIQGKKIESAAIDLILQLVGNDLALIEREIEKLTLFLSESKELITVEAVQDSIAAVPNATLSNLFEAINQRDASLAIEALLDITARDESIPYLVISLYNHMNKLLRFADYDRFPDPATARKLAGTASSRTQRGLWGGSRRYSLPELKSAVGELAEIDYQFRQKNYPVMAYFSNWVAGHLN